MTQFFFSNKKQQHCQCQCDLWNNITTAHTANSGKPARPCWQINSLTVVPACRSCDPQLAGHSSVPDRNALRITVACLLPPWVPSARKHQPRRSTRLQSYFIFLTRHVLLNHFDFQPMHLCCPAFLAQERDRKSATVIPRSMDHLELKWLQSQIPPGDPGVSIFHAVEPSLEGHMVQREGELAPQQVIPQSLNYPLDSQALFFRDTRSASFWLMYSTGWSMTCTCWDRTSPRPLLEASAPTRCVTTKVLCHLASNLGLEKGSNTSTLSPSANCLNLVCLLCRCCWRSWALSILPW